MERLLILAVTVIVANSQTHYSYFNIHRAEVAPLPTFRPFNHNLDPLLVTPSSVGDASEVPGVPAPVETATAAPTSGSATTPSTQEGASQLPNSFYFNSFEQHRGNQQFNPFLFNGLNSLNHNQAKSISASVPQIPQSILQSLPNLPRTFPGQTYGQGFPFTGFNQFPRQFPQVTPQVTTFLRGPQGHYHTVHNQNPFGYGYNPYQGILPPPIIYQIIYYNIPAVNGTTNNGTEVTEATTKGSIVVEIPTVPSTSSRIVEEVTPKATTSSLTTTTTTTTTTTEPTTTTSASTTTTKSSETEETTVTTETTTTSTENTTEK